MKYKLFLILLNLLFFLLVLDIDTPNTWFLSIFIALPCFFIFTCQSNNVYKILATLLVINFQYKQLSHSYTANAYSYQGFIFAPSKIHSLYKKNSNFDPIKKLEEITNDYSRQNLNDVIEWDLITSKAKDQKLKVFFSSLNQYSLDHYQQLVLNRVPDSDLSLFYESACSKLRNNQLPNQEAIKIAINRFYNDKNPCHLSLKSFLEDGYERKI